MTERTQSATSHYIPQYLFRENDGGGDRNEHPPGSAVPRRYPQLSGSARNPATIAEEPIHVNLPANNQQEEAPGAGAEDNNSGFLWFPLDRNKSAGRESLASRGSAEGSDSLRTRRGSSVNHSVNFVTIDEQSGAVEAKGTAQPFAVRPPTGGMERLPTRAGAMSANPSQRHITSGRMMRSVEDFNAPPSRGGPQGGGEGGQVPMARPTTSGRILTARPISAALKGAPATATRLLSAASVARPGTRTGLATGLGFNTPINVVDRPITQQGLTGMKTGSRGPQRQVQDASYFMGLLRAKMTELGGEISKINEDIVSMKKEQSSFLTYDKRVKETAQELAGLQGSLADYNLLIDLMNTDTEKMEIDEECQELTQQNQEDAEKLDSLFSEKKSLEHTVRALEAQLEEERHVGETVFQNMDPHLKKQYTMLRDENRFMQQDQEAMQEQIDSLNSRKNALEDEISMSKVKREAVSLSERLQEIEEKRDELVQEKQQRGTPQEERERLLLQVKDDNAEIATMERQIADTAEHITRLQNELQEVDQEIEDNQSERSQKYRELRKREETMEQFMSNFEQSRVEELERLDQLEGANVELLEKLSRNMIHMGGLPNVAEYDALRGDLAFKEGELEKSRYTVQSLQQEHMNLQGNLQKIEALESKVQKELVDVKEKIQKMQDEIVEFSDLDGLRLRAEEKRKNLAVEKDELEAKKIALTFTLQDIETATRMLTKQLNDNDTHSQLVNLEKKWALLEQSNFTIKEFVAQKKAESDYIPIKNQAMKIVVEYNRVLQEVIASGGIIG